VEEHEDCRKALSGEVLSSENSILPTRVIDVSPPDEPQIPRLVQTNGLMTGRWIALSHCWVNQTAAPSPPLELLHRRG
jgi:hypothetical protein